MSFSHIPFIVITFLIILIGIFPSFVLEPMQQIVNILGPEPTVSHPDFVMNPLLSKVGIASFILILLVGLVFFIRTKIAGSKPAIHSPTWGCGYGVPNYRMQYTGKSFSKSFSKLFSFITREQKKYTEIERHEIFPASRHYQSNYPEYFENTIIDKVLNQIFHFMNRFSFIHNGLVQRYILYGFLFMMLLLMATLFNRL